MDDEELSYRGKVNGSPKFQKGRGKAFAPVPGLGNVVRQLRGEMPIKTFADLIGCDESFIYRIETKRTKKVSFEFIMTLCQSLKISLSEFSDKLYEYGKSE